ncbi:MAG: hypothetical protein ABIG44_03095 [Planctomycetota bacterium]
MPATLALIPALILLQAAELHRAPDNSSNPHAALVIIAGGYRPLTSTNLTRPEPYWLQLAHLYARLNPRVVVAYGHDLPAALDAVDDALRARGFEQIAAVEFWSHGNAGYFRINEHRYRAGIFTKPSTALAPRLKRLRAQLCDRASVHWRTCSTFHGEKGHRFAQAASKFFCATGKQVIVMGYTRPVGLTFPGGHALRPGQSPYWPVCEGRSEQGLRGVLVLARDLARLASATLYDLIPYVRARDTVLSLVTQRGRL